DIESLRWGFGIVTNSEEQEARRIIDALGTALARGPVTEALRAVVEFADEHAADGSSLPGLVRVVVGLGEIDGFVRQLRYLAAQHGSPAEHVGRETFVQYASQE